MPTLEVGSVLSQSLNTETASYRDEVISTVERTLPLSAAAMDGYAKVASLMCKYEEFAILKRFKSLNYQNLLYRQAEITYLREDLEKLAERDATVPDRQFYTKDWWTLAHTATKQQGGEQWRKVQQIRKKLDEYSKWYENSRHPRNTDKRVQMTNS